MEYLPVIYSVPPLTFKVRKGYGCIYAYLLKDGKYYIGQTRGNLKQRHNRHIHVRNCPVDKFLTSLDVPRILCTAPVSALNQLEQYYISKYNSVYPNGWNFTTGGDTPEVSPIVFSETVRNNMSLAHIGKIPPNRKRVYCYSIEGEYITMYNSCSEAYMHCTGLRTRCATSIIDCANGKCKSAYGFRWCYTK